MNTTLSIPLTDDEAQTLGKIAISLRKDNNIFNTTYGIGYWAFGARIADTAPSRGWLLFVSEHGDKDPTDAMTKTAQKAYAAQAPLPRRKGSFAWYALDAVKAATVCAYLVKLYGFKDSYDLTEHDMAIQYAVFGNQVYG